MRSYFLTKLLGEGLSQFEVCNATSTYWSNTMQPPCGNCGVDDVFLAMDHDGDPEESIRAEGYRTGEYASPEAANACKNTRILDGHTPRAHR